MTTALPDGATAAATAGESAPAPTTPEVVEDPE